MINEKKTDLFIARLLDKASINYTPNGSDIKEIKEALKTASKKGSGNAGFPEFVGKSGEFIIVIENKSELDKQVLYKNENNDQLNMETDAIINYAENGALHYAKEILKKTNFKKIFAFGCSGDEKHNKIRPIFVNDRDYKLLQEVENFENFSETNINEYYKEQVKGETPAKNKELKEILNKAELLHEHLRNYGQLGDSEKPLVVSAILLALSEKNFKISTLIGDDKKTDGEKIFDSLTTHLKRVEVQPEAKKERILNQFNIVKDRPLLNQVDDRLAKTPLKYFTEFIEDKILSFITNNSAEDILGKFYGEFVRYSGINQQSLGVVLTPYHITKLFCDLLEIKPDDRVFDPCCGTGSFLLTAMNEMLKKADSKEQIEEIKKEQIFGIEVREDMFSIATTNMILRGDGKSNLVCNNFLDFSSQDLRKNNYTVGFMNPPYSQAKKEDTSHLSEINFIKHLLDGMVEGGRCAVIVPQSAMIGKNKKDRKVKKHILKEHTLEGVITLSKDTFYNIGTNPCIAIFTARKPHPAKKHCKFINFEDDGFKIRKHIGLVETERAKERKTHLLDCWLYDAPAESKFMVKTTIEATDEWLHSFYYFNDEIPKEADFEEVIADYLSFEFDMIINGRGYLFEGDKNETEE